MVWSFFTLCTYAAGSERQLRQLVLFFFSLTRQYNNNSRSCGLRFSGTRRGWLINHQHFDSTSFGLRLCPYVTSQSIHTSTCQLDSVASGLAENGSISAAERDDVASVAHLSN